MSYRVLARKYRPQKFSQVAGQQHVLNSLINGLDYNRLHHSYLFTGTRGVGKTSLARLLAKSLNCLMGISSSPCGKCHNCIAVKSGNFIDLIEVDAASRTKIEDTREILENIQYMPSQGRFKIYIIDEVHMLSNHSFNALLKTLEEPPQHIKFILATTDIEKLPATIISRCLQFYLKNLTDLEIYMHLVRVLKAEKIDFQEKSLKYISRAAKGSVRDALSLTDQSIAFSNGKILNESVEAILGIVDIEVVDKLIGYIISSDVSKLISLSNRIIMLGKDPILVLDGLAHSFYAAIIYQLTKEIYCVFCSKLQLIEISKHLSIELLQHYYYLTIKNKKYIYLAPNFESGLGMALLKLCSVLPEVLPKYEQDKNHVAGSDIVPEAVLKEIRPLEKAITNLESGFSSKHSCSLDIGVSLPTPAVEQNKDIWYRLSESLKLKGSAMQVVTNSSLESACNSLYKLKPDKRIKSLITQNIQQKIEEALSLSLGQPTKIQFLEENGTESISLEQKLHDNVVSKTTPAEIRQYKKIKKIKEITGLLNNNPNISKLEKLGFILDVNSITLKNNFNNNQIKN